MKDKNKKKDFKSIDNVTIIGDDKLDAVFISVVNFIEWFNKR